MRITSTRIGGFTLTELIVTVAVIVVLSILFLNQPRGRGGKSPRIKCVNNLKNVGLAYRIYATDNEDHFPWEPGTNRLGPRTYALADALKFTLMVSNELSAPFILSCPADLDRPQQTSWTNLTSVQKLSYFVGVDAREVLPHTIMGGDRNVMTNGTSLSLAVRNLRHDANVAWDENIHKSQGNILMADGSVQQTSSARLKSLLREYATNEITSATWIVP